MRILSDALASERGDLYQLVPQGKALQTDFCLAEEYRKASLAYASAVLPVNADAAPLIADMREVMTNYAANGVPAEVVDALKRRFIARMQFDRNSISDLADEWSDALAAKGLDSPDEDVEAVRRVTVEDVNRIAKQYLVEHNSITAQLKPLPAGGK